MGATKEKALKLREEASLRSLDARLLTEKPELADDLYLFGKPWSGATLGR